MLISHEVTDYRTAETGLVAGHLTNGKFLSVRLQDAGLPGACRVNKAPLFREVRDRVLALIRDKIIVGHSLWQFLSASNDALSIY
jgi:hypothetical protein